MLIRNTSGYIYINIIDEVKTISMSSRKKKQIRAIEKNQMNVGMIFIGCVW